MSRRKQIAELLKRQRTSDNEAYFNTKVASIQGADKSIAALRENLDFGVVDTDAIDAVCDPVIAAFTAAGRAEMRPLVAVDVTTDVADKRKALLTAAVLGKEHKVGDASYEVLPVEKIIKDQFGDLAAGLSPMELWNTLVQAHESVALSDKEIDIVTSGGKVARLAGTSQITTSSTWGTTLIQVLVEVARMLHDASQLTAWTNSLIPPAHRTTVSDFNDRYVRYDGQPGELETVAEDAKVPTVNVSDSFRIPVRPVKKQGEFYLTMEQITINPSNAIQRLARAMGMSISRTDYKEIMNLMFGTGTPSTNAPTKTLGYESTVKDGTVDFYDTTNSRSGASMLFNYDNAVSAIAEMSKQVSYGEDPFSLAGILMARTLVVPPEYYRTAVRLTESLFKPGAANNEVNELAGLEVIPISRSDFNATNLKRVFAVIADRADAQMFIYSSLNGQPPAFQPNTKRDDSVEYNRISFKVSNVRRINVVDKRASYLTRSTDG